MDEIDFKLEDPELQLRQFSKIIYLKHGFVSKISSSYAYSQR